MSLHVLAESYVTRKELAKHLGVSKQTIARWQGDGLPAEVWGRRLVRYRLSTVLAWLDERGS